jgi:lipid-A-disaccharide synthase
MASPRPPQVCLVTVDPSGDAIGAELARALARRAEVQVIGAGGPLMREAGVELLAETTHLTAVGAAGWLAVYARAWVRYRLLLRSLARRRPDLLVPIDSGGFNMPLVTRAKRRPELKVLYYVPPRSWHRDWRVAPLAPVVDYVAAPFAWNSAGDDGTGRVRFVGHPAADLPTRLPPRDEVRESLGLAPGQPTLALLPGSRRWELRMHLPVMAEAVRLLRAKVPGLQVVVSRARNVRAQAVEACVGAMGGAHAVEGAGLALRAADAALVCMGTATLEACVLGVPLVAFYRCTRLTLLQLLFWKPSTRLFALPNIIAGEAIVPELLQEAASGERLAQEVLPLLTDDGARAAAKERLGQAAQLLGEPGASDRAAQAVLDALNGRWHALAEEACPARVVETARSAP